MDFFETVQARYSYRGEFTQDPVPRAHLDQILQAGVASPTGHNYQTPQLIAVTRPDLLAEIGSLFSYPAAKTAQAVIVVLSHKKPMPNGIDFEMVDYAIATQSMLLAVTALGYGTVWIDGQLYEEGRADKLRQLLHIPPQFTPRVVLPLGVPKAPGPRREKIPFAQRVHYDTFT